jgi:outer membrane protein
MRPASPLISALCAFLLCMPAGAQQPAPAKTGAILEQPRQWHDRWTHPYRAKEVAPVNLANSPRLESLIRAGQLYLSLSDAIALAIENNLDVEIARYQPRIAQFDLMRAKAGGVVTSRGTAASTSTAAGAGVTGAASAGGAVQSVAVAVPAGGSPVPSFDPVLTGAINWGHFSAPQINSFIVGTSVVTSNTTNGNFTLARGFSTGARAQLGWNNRRSLSSSARADLNPSITSDLNLSITQPLLQGFGTAINNRYIRIAKNNVKLGDLQFKSQLITTVSTIVNLYWDLVSYREDVVVKRKALDLAQKLYEDNQKQVEIGTLAPIEVVRAEAEVAARQQDLTIAETNVLQQETIIKNFLSRNGVASPTIAQARVVPTDRIRVPETEVIPAYAELIDKAIAARPELALTQVQLDSAQIALKGAKNGLLPSLDAIAYFRNNGLAGDVNTLPPIGGGPGVRVVDPFITGGWGTATAQVLRRNFPDYQVGAQLNIPIRNRSAQADVVTAQLQLRQSELRRQQQINAVRVEVQNALIALQQARARYQAATKARVLAEQTLDAEQKKYALGASTIFMVIQAQRDLAQAQYSEVVAQGVYARAKNELDRATGNTLEANRVVLEEALAGTVSTRP